MSSWVSSQDFAELPRRLEPCPKWSAADAAALRDTKSLVARLLQAQLQELGLSPMSEQQPSRTGQAAVLPQFERWLEASFRLLASEDASDSGAQPSLGNQWREHVRLLKDRPLLGPQLRLLEVMLSQIPDILQGRRCAVEVMFPGGSPELVESLYVANPVFAFLHDVVARIVATVVSVLSRGGAQQRVRILEVGAGTGSTTRCVLQRLEPFAARIGEYCFTDISPHLVRKAATHLDRCGVPVTFRTLDLETDPAQQGFGQPSYDIIVAANVLHATADIRETLRNVRYVLTTGGCLVINETLGADLLAHVTFGLLDGWWRYRDADLREPATPALSPVTWTQVLEQTGFRSVRFLAQEAQRFGQQVMVAEACAPQALKEER